MTGGPDGSEEVAGWRDGWVTFIVPDEKSADNLTEIPL